VVRPDSGEPSEVVSECLAILLKAFKEKSVTNSKGYDVLPSQIRMIQGDGMDAFSIQPIYDAMHNRKQSSDNITFGSGAGTLQKMDRDTFKMAMKQSARKDRQGIWHDVFKNPVTDRTKASKKGRLQLFKDSDGFFTAREECQDQYGEGYLQTVFENGVFTNISGSFEDIRRRAALAV